MRVFVTGVGGQLGFDVVNELKKRGYEAIGSDILDEVAADCAYVKLDITRYLTIISKLREQGFQLTKEQELRAANIPFDETEEPLRALFFHFLRLHQQGEALPQPELPQEGPRTLPDLELYCRKLDLYFSFAKAFGCPVDENASHKSFFILPSSFLISRTCPWSPNNRNLVSTMPSCHFTCKNAVFSAMVSFW